MSCRCDAAYEREVDCPRCSKAPPPDGPDELLSELAEEEAVLAEMFPVGEDDAPTEPMPTLPEPVDEVLRASESVLCNCCSRWVPFELVAPLDAIRRRLISAASARCPCGQLISICWSWTRRCVVALRYGGSDPPILLN